MKYIKLFEEFKINYKYLKFITEDEFEIISDGVIHFKGDVDLRKFEGDKIPFDFSKCIVDGSFRLSNNKIKNLIGLPKKVGKTLYLNGCNLESLEGISEYVGKDLHLSKNFVKNLEYFPNYIGGSIYLNQNDLNSIVGIPKDFNGTLNLAQNPYLRTLRGCPNRLETLDITYTKIYNFEGFPPHLNDMLIYNDTTIQPLVRLFGYDVYNSKSYSDFYSNIDYLNDMNLIEDRLDVSSKPRIKKKNLLRILDDLNIEINEEDLELISNNYELY
jgi:hypothetical protein